LSLGDGEYGIIINGVNRNIKIIISGDGIAGNTDGKVFSTVEVGITLVAGRGYRSFNIGGCA